MIVLLKTAIVLFLFAWMYLGGWLVVRYNVLFGPHRDDPAETPGARSFGVAHIGAVWIGAFALAIYFLFR
ncbi:hypothetical protein [Luteolibacter sp. LG18]|uniref:hypothetical protein n=1 Tax=Luteolibacter sp. LG18 TaxID=2819286 RepID=UPI002B2D29B9|nr:hypothetical protein llg_05960 [Luteolibacter sp. LG18]